MKQMIKDCSRNWYEGKCQLSNELKGWGCRLLTCLPEEMPISVNEKASLFCKVYSYAENSGVTACCHFRESDIDAALDNDEMMRQMILLNQPLRADLLSEEIETYI